MIHRLFVYGTLRKDALNEHALWLYRNGRFQGSARIRGRLYLVTHYPALGAPVTEDDWIRGDLFAGISPTVFMRLDKYEGIEYERVRTTVEAASGKLLVAFVYRYTRQVGELKPIPSGDWREFRPSLFA